MNIRQKPVHPPAVAVKPAGGNGLIAAAAGSAAQQPDQICAVCQMQKKTSKV